jgi:hypothetical protein
MSIDAAVFAPGTERDCIAANAGLPLPASSINRGTAVKHHPGPDSVRASEAVTTFLYAFKGGGFAAAGAALRALAALASSPAPEARDTHDRRSAPGTLHGAAAGVGEPRGIKLPSSAADPHRVDTALVTAWTRRHARVRGLLAVFAACVSVALIVMLPTLARDLPVASLLVIVALLVWNLWETYKGFRTWSVMRRIGVRVTQGGFAAEGHRGHVTAAWADVARVEVDRSSEPLGRPTRQLAVYVVLHDGRRIELDALRVDGVQRTVARKRALLEPYRKRLEAAAQRGPAYAQDGTPPASAP